MKSYSVLTALLTFVLSSSLSFHSLAIPVTADSPMLLAKTKGVFNRSENLMTVMTLHCDTTTEKCDPLLNTSALVEYSFFTDQENAFYLFAVRATAARADDQCQLQIKSVELSDGTTKIPVVALTKVGIKPNTYYTVTLKMQKNPECFRFQTQILAWSGAASETPVVTENCTQAGNSSLLFAHRDQGVSVYEKGRPPKPFASTSAAVACGRSLTLVDPPQCLTNEGLPTDATSKWDWLQSRCRMSSDDGHQYEYVVDRLTPAEPISLSCLMDGSSFYQTQFATCRSIILDGEQLK